MADKSDNVQARQPFKGGDKVRYPASKARPSLFPKGEGTVAEVLQMNRRYEYAYRVNDADGEVLPVLFASGELQKPSPRPRPEPDPKKRNRS
jgi:hypothetical protein